jgi:hypothetical protein
MLMGITIYNDFIGNLNVVVPLYGTAQDSPSGIPSADPDFSLFMLCKQ